MVDHSNLAKSKASTHRHRNEEGAADKTQLKAHRLTRAALIDGAICGAQYAPADHAGRLVTHRGLRGSGLDRAHHHAKSSRIIATQWPRKNETAAKAKGVKGVATRMKIAGPTGWPPYSLLKKWRPSARGA